MGKILIGAQSEADRSVPRAGWVPPRRTARSGLRRAVVAAWVAMGLVLLAAPDAPAFTLKLVFPDGQPMTYGSACNGDGCLQRGAITGYTDFNGEISLGKPSDGIVEYRRDGIDLSQVRAGDASGRVRAEGAQATVVLPWLLSGTTPALDAVEADVAARVNEARRARGLAPATLDGRLSTAADLHATWLSSGNFGLGLPALSHLGPYNSTLAFRLGSVSFPEPVSGSEIAAAGSSAAEVITTWLGSAPHRERVLEPGPLLLGVARVGNVIIVDTHPPCTTCPQTASATGDARAPARTGTPVPLSGSSTGGGATGPGSSGARAASCGAERLRVKRLRNRRGRMRLSVGVQCLRPGARYTLSIMQRPSQSVLLTRRIPGAGTLLLALRPRRTTHTLRIKLKRNGAAIAARSVRRARG